jgi:hypothetical protein
MLFSILSKPKFIIPTKIIYKSDRLITTLVLQKPQEPQKHTLVQQQQK